MTKVAPPPGVVSTRIVPPWACTKPREIASPSPLDVGRRARGPQPQVGLEHAPALGVRDAGAVVDDAQHEPAVALRRVDQHRRVVRVRGGVLEQVDEHLADHRLIDVTGASSSAR